MEPTTTITSVPLGLSGYTWLDTKLSFWKKKHNLLQSSSSELSGQSLIWSHTFDLSTHLPSTWHRNWSSSHWQVGPWHTKDPFIHELQSSTHVVAHSAHWKSVWTLRESAKRTQNTADIRQLLSEHKQTGGRLDANQTQCHTLNSGLL